MDQPRIIQFPEFQSKGASLSVAEGKDLPFEIKRVFWLTRIEDLVIRGKHAHRTSRQLLVALNGVIEVTLEDLNGESSSYVLDSCKKALFIPPLYWGELSFHKNTIGLALADDNFNEQDYIRDYEDFRKMKYDL